MENKSKKLNAIAAAVVLTLGLGAAHAASFVDIQADAIAAVPVNADADVAGTATGAVEIEYRLLGGAISSVDLDSGTLAADRSVVYSSGVALSNGTTLTFTVANGAFEDGSDWALYANTGAGTWIKVTGNVADFTADANGNYTVLKLEIDTSGFTGVEMVELQDGSSSAALAANAALPANTLLLLGKGGAALAAGENAQVVANANLGIGAAVTIAVTEARNTSGTSLNAPLASAEDVIVAIDGISGVLTQDEAVIDVEASPSRTDFIVSANTTLDTSVASFTLVQSAEVAINMATTAWTATTHRDDVAGVTGVSVDPFVGAAINDAAATAGAFVSAGAAASDLEGGANTVTITNNEVTPLQTGDWDFTLTLDPAGAITAFDVDLGETNSHVWTINGAQAKVPYLAISRNASTSSYLTFLKVVNESAGDEPVLADVLITDVNGNVVTTAGALTSVNVGTAKGYGNTTISQNALYDAVKAAALAQQGVTMDDNLFYHFAFTFTVSVAQNSVHISGIQKDPNGRTVTTTLYNTNNGTDGRKWQ